ncbi:uncharacterized protein LOC117018238 isoform X2 [Rhinolophus ferrumequinum]|uniref:uncharacterized protein LOC117018238 isoform X2 n=1 Tax=Rhinolophus ferrumequinum TaxID=59479 RepID=UPI00140F8CC6|nr:uncharacterized protein LOC117018238 isoform X2 [Rhinolophus ferrumequinum]
MRAWSCRGRCGTAAVHAPPHPARRSPPGSFQVHPELRSGSAVSVREPYRKPAPRQTRGSSDCRKTWVTERARNRARPPPSCCLSPREPPPCPFGNVAEGPWRVLRGDGVVPQEGETLDPAGGSIILCEIPSSLRGSLVRSGGFQGRQEAALFHINAGNPG